MLRPCLVLPVMSSQRLEMPLPRVVRRGVARRGPRERAVEMKFRHFEEGGGCPEQSFRMQRRFDRGRIVSREETRLQLQDPVPALRQRRTGVACQMTLESQLVEALVIHRAEFPRQ